MELSDIHFHDCGLLRVVELPDSHDLLFEVDYPVDWGRDVFARRVIAFRDVLDYRVEEGDCVGAPTLLGAVDEGSAGDRRRVRIETSHGTRSLCFRAVELLARLPHASAPPEP